MIELIKHFFEPFPIQTVNGFAWLVAFYVVSLLLTVGTFIASLFQSTNAPSTEVNKLEVPVTELGKPLAVIFGTVLQKNVHIYWWGKIKVVKKKVNANTKK